MKRILAFFCIASVLILSVASVSAGTTLRNESIPTQISAGSRLSGTLTVVFNDENLDAELVTNWGDSISLRSLLELNNKQSGTHYNCSNANCMPHYETGEAVRTTTLNEGGMDVGFVLEGASVRNVRDVRVDIAGSSAPSCFPDMNVDVLNIGEHVVTSARYIEQGCYQPRYGCFETDRGSYQSVSVPTGSASYCEKITLPAAPAFKVGARLTNSSSGSSTLSMKLYQMSGTLLGQCTLPAFTQGEQELSCIIQRGSLVQEDYFVCVNANTASNYRIRAEANAPCGTTDRGVTYAADYEIFAQNLQFDTPLITLNDPAFRNSTGEALLPLIQSYLSETYGNNCQPNCIIPIRIRGVAQDIVISNAFIRYDSAIGAGVESSDVYALTKENATIDSGILALDLSLANFTIPSDFSGRNIELSIGDDRLLRKSVNVSSGFAFSVTPTFAAFGRETLFSISPAQNITQVVWNFGDGTPVQSSLGASVRHRYTTQGSFTLAIDATNSRGQTGHKSVLIVVGDPQSAVDDTLALYEGDLRSISGNMSSYPIWLQQELRTRLELNSMNQTVAAARTARSFAVNESDFIEIMNTLSSVRVPSRVGVSTRGTLPLSVGSAAMDISLLGELESVTISNEDLQNRVLFWMNEHYSPSVKFETYQAYYGDLSEPVLTRFVVDLNARGQRVPTRLVIGYPADSVRLVSSVSGNDSLSRGVSVGVSESANSVEFSVVGMVTPQELGAYLAPAQLAELGDLQAPSDVACNYDNICSDDEDRKSCPNDCKPWGSATVIVIVIAVVAAIVYLAIRWWYQHRYENDLFPKKQDLYNVLTFISNAKRAGVSDKEIHKKLKAAGWTGEQATYALSKYAKDTKPADKKTPAKFIKSSN